MSIRLQESGAEGAAVDAALSQVEAGIEVLRRAGFDALTNTGRIEALERLERIGRTLPALGHALINQLGEQGAAAECAVRNLREVLISRLRITGPDASGRIAAARALGPTRALTGEPVEPALAATAAAQHEGAIGADHAQVIRQFVKHLPGAVGDDECAEAEHALAALARRATATEVHKAAQRLAAYLNPDGAFDDKDRTARAYVRVGKQGPDKMTKGSFCLDPELVAYLEALFAKYARPGACNPDDDRPAVDTDPTEDQARRDTRSQGKRQHDALKAGLRALLASGQLGRHRGLPVTAIFTLDLADLNRGTAMAVTGGGSLLPIRDALRMAAHAHHYLTVFDEHTGRPLYLGRTKRLATADQRIVLHARDIGCTYPGCDAPAYHCQTHHLDEWGDGGCTDIDRLTLACDTHHPLVGDGEDQWATTTTRPGRACAGRTRWHPPARIDPTRAGRLNHHHHPLEHLTTSSDGDGVDGDDKDGDDKDGDDEPRKPHGDR